MILKTSCEDEKGKGILQKLESCVYIVAALLVVFHLPVHENYILSVYLLCQLTTLTFNHWTSKTSENAVYRVGADAGLLNCILLPLAVTADIHTHSGEDEADVKTRGDVEAVVISVVTAITLLFTDTTSPPSNRGTWLQRGTTLIALALLTSLSVNEVVLCLFLTTISCHINEQLPQVLPRCFTYGELFTVSQIIILVSWRILHSLFWVKEISQADIFCSVGITGLVLAVLLCYLLNTSVYPAVFYIIYAWLTVVFIIPVLYIYLQEFPLLWLIKFIFKSYTRVLLLSYWAGCSVLAGCIVGYHNSTGENGQILTIIRKYFHLVVVVVYVPGLIVDVEFLYLSSVVAVAFFVILETIRVCNIPPFGNIIDQSFGVFTDGRDQGVIVLTHFYLLIGLSLPLWISTSHTSVSGITLYSGVLSLGIGDTVASITGSKIGRYKWPGTKKTVEGTVCSILSQCFTVFTFHYLGIFIVSSSMQVGLAVVLSSLLEAFTSQIDNLVLPVLTYSLLAVT